MVKNKNNMNTVNKCIFSREEFFKKLCQIARNNNKTFINTVISKFLILNPWQSFSIPGNFS